VEIIDVSFLGKEICFDKKLRVGLKMEGKFEKFYFLARKEGPQALWRQIIYIFY
jgi:hypothetical protein